MTNTPKKSEIKKRIQQTIGVKTPKTTNVKLGVKTPNAHTQPEHEHGSFGRAFSYDPRQENTSDT